METEIKLKSCPFCGGEAKMTMDYHLFDSPTFYVSCRDCGAKGEITYADEKAARTWNRRGEMTPIFEAALLHERLFSKSPENDDNAAHNCTADDSGNAAAMREALEAARDLLLPQCNGGTAFAKACGETVNKIMDALAEPPRNCDVGTAEEQEARFHDTGELYHTLTLRNALTWAQMPYEEGGAK